MPFTRITRPAEPARDRRSDSDASSSRPAGLGLVAGSALTLAGVLGSGVLVLPGLALAAAGPAALMALVALLVLSAPLAITFAALGSRFPGAGGVSGFVARGLGPGAAAVTAWWFYLGVPLGVPALGLFAGNYVEAALGGGTTTRVGTAAMIIAVAAVANAGGVRISGAVQIVLTGTLVTTLLIVIALAAPHAELNHLSPLAPHGWSAIGPAALVLVWLLTGWEAISHLTGRFRNPGRDLPRATVVTLIMVAVLFGGLMLAQLTVLGTDAASSVAPVTALLARSIGPAAGIVGAAIAIMVTLGNTNAYLAGLAELGGEIGRTGHGPRWLAGESTAVPRRSLAVVTVYSLATLALVPIFRLSTESLVLVTAASQVAVYAIGLLAALRLLPRGSAGWWSAVLSLPPILLLVILSGAHLIAPAALAVAALVYRQLATPRLTDSAQGKSAGTPPTPAAGD